MPGVGRAKPSILPCVIVADRLGAGFHLGRLGVAAGLAQESGIILHRLGCFGTRKGRGAYSRKAKNATQES